MNRWQGWAKRLRSRHSRIDARRAQGGMVLLRGPGAVGCVTPMSRPSIVHLHACFTVSPLLALSLRPAVAASTIVRLATSNASARHAGRAEAATGPTSASLAQRVLSSSSRHAPPAFVSRTLTPARALLAPPAAFPVQLPARHREIVSPMGAHALDIASRLRRNASRQELTSLPNLAILAAPYRAAATAAASAAQVANQALSARGSFEEARHPQPAPAINVDALTGMVIQQIDRRLVAYRERMGRA